MRASLGSAAFVSLLFGARIASAGTDFATCPQTISNTCSATVTSCCKLDFAPVGTTKAIVIPMDRCHQQSSTSGPEAPPGSGPPRNADGTPSLGNGWCADPIGTADDGVFQVYGLIYRLMQKGIPVYWVVNPTKKPPALTQYQNLSSEEYLPSDVDVWVLGTGVTAPPTQSTGLTSCGAGCTQPIHRLSSTLTPIANSYNYKELPMRGGAFVIAPQDRAKFDAFWKHTGEFSTLGSKYGFPGIDLYEIDASARFGYQDFTVAAPYTFVDNYAPVAAKLNYTAPRIARLGSTSAVATSWLAKANLDDPATNASCTSGTFVPSDAVYCNVADTDIQSGALVTGQFMWAWIDKWSDNSPCDTAAEKTMFDKIANFMVAVPGVRNAGNVLFMESAVQVAESCPNRQILGVQNAGLGLHATNTSINETASQPFIIREPQNLYVQWGDMPANFQSGAVTAWEYAGNGAAGYQAAFNGAGSTLHRLVTYEHAATTSNPTCDRHRSTATCDVYAASTGADVTDLAAYGRYQNSAINGVAFYTGGNQVQNVSSHLRMVLNALIATPLATVDETTVTVTEVSRAQPIVGTVGTSTTAIFQGTYEHLDPQPPVPVLATAADASTFQFPYLKGHMRAVATSSIATASTSYTTLSALFDAANGIPSASYSGCSTSFSASCRTVFTTTAGGAHPARVMIRQSNAAALGPLVASNLTATEWDVLLSRVLAGVKTSSGNYVPKLGGIDRSTVAVIPASSVAGGARPTMVYFGAADGMLHAVCASVQAPCDAVGRELWAYIPRTLLGDLRYNTAHIDGSPRVVDMFGDFYGTGHREFRTIMMFQTGTGDATDATRTPAVYALDITSPADPQVLWEYTMSDVTARETFELGQGLTLAAGRVAINGTTKNVAFAQTNNLGTGGAGSVVVALDIESGAVLWKTGYAYPAARDAQNPNVPTTGIPGGLVAVDKVGGSTITDLVLGTLYGDVLELDAATGANRFGTTPLFRFTTDFHPIGAVPAIYASGHHQMAVVVSGGYADPHDSSWASASTQYAVAINLDTPSEDTALDEASGAPNVPFVVSMGTSERGFAQPLIVGGQLFFTTDTSDVNTATYGTGGSTGHAYRLDLSTGASGLTVVIAGGASSVVNSWTNLFTGSSSAVQQLSGAQSANGTSVDILATAKASRELWLRTQ